MAAHMSLKEALILLDIMLEEIFQTSKNIICPLEREIFLILGLILTLSSQASNPFT